MDAKGHIEAAREIAESIDEDELSTANLIALGRLHVEIAHADATADIAFYTKSRELRERGY